MRGARMRRIGGALLVVGGALAAWAPASSASVPPARLHLHLTKLCPRAELSPTFHVVNVTDEQDAWDEQWFPETLGYTITKGGRPDSEVLYRGTLAPGQEDWVTVPGAPWAGPHYVQFDAWFRGVKRHYASRQYCSCETVSATTTSTSAPTSTTTSAPPTSTTAPTGSTTTTSRPAGSTTSSPSTTALPTTTAGAAGTTTTSGPGETTISAGGSTTTTTGTPSGTLPTTGGRLPSPLGFAALITGAALVASARQRPVGA